MLRHKRQAGPSRLQAVRPRTNQSSQSTSARLVVPMIEDVAAPVSQRQLESVRAQVQPGERVGVYRRDGRIRVLIAGPERLHRVLPVLLQGEWTLIGAVEVTEDGERALPVLMS